MRCQEDGAKRNGCVWEGSRGWGRDAGSSVTYLLFLVVVCRSMSAYAHATGYRLHTPRRPFGKVELASR